MREKAIVSKGVRDKPLIFNKMFIIVSLIALELILGLSVLIMPYHLLLLFLMLALVLIIFINPKNGYLFLIFSLPLTGSNVTLELGRKGSSVFFTGGLGGIDFLVPLTLIVALCYFLKMFLEQKKINWEISKVDYPLIALLVLAIISIFWCPQKTVGIFFGLKFIFVILLYLLTVWILDNQKIIQQAISIWIVTGIFYSSIGLILFFTHGGRLSALSDNANNFAGFINICLLLTIGQFYVTKKSLERFLLFPAISLMLFASFLTGSRSGFIGMFIAIIMFLFFIISYADPFKRVLKTALAACILIFLLLFAIVAINKLVQNVSSTDLGIEGFRRLVNLANPLESQSFKMRIRLWKFIFKVLSENPLIYLVGTGAGGFIELGKDYNLKVLLKQDIIYHPHNIFLHLLIEYGILGVTIAGWFLVYFSRICIQTIKTLKYSRDKIIFYSFFCGMCSYFVLLMVEIPILEKTHWMFLGLWVAMTKIYIKDNLYEGEKKYLIPGNRKQDR
jgi:O-antigen ligase